MKNFVKYARLFLVAFLAVALLFVVPVMAMGHADATPPPAAETPSEVARVVDLVFLVAIVGFFKEQFRLADKTFFGMKATIAVALPIGAVIWFLPEIQAAVPIAGQILAYFKWFLGGVGGFDTVVNGGRKITGNEEEVKAKK